MSMALPRLPHTPPRTCTKRTSLASVSFANGEKRSATKAHVPAGRMPSVTMMCDWSAMAA
jgi:hypothetical protein